MASSSNLIRLALEDGDVRVVPLASLNLREDEDGKVQAFLASTIDAEEGASPPSMWFTVKSTLVDVHKAIVANGLRVIEPKVKD